MVPVDKKFDRVILYGDKGDIVSKSIFIASKASPLFKSKGKTTYLFDPQIFSLTQLQSAIGKNLSQEKYFQLLETALSESTVLILKIRKGFLLANKTILPKNITTEILFDKNKDLYYLIYGFSPMQSLDMEIILVEDNEKIRAGLEQNSTELTSPSKVLQIFNEPPSEYDVSYNGVGYEIKFGPAGLYPINDQAGVRFIIAVMKRRIINEDELIRFGNKYFTKAVEDQIYVLKRARRNKEELIKDLKTIEQNKNIPPEQSLSKHLEDSINITEAGYTISYNPIPTIQWKFNLSEDFFKF